MVLLVFPLQDEIEQPVSDNVSMLREELRLVTLENTDLRKANARLEAGGRLQDARILQLEEALRHFDRPIPPPPIMVRIASIATACSLLHLASLLGNTPFFEQSFGITF